MLCRDADATRVLRDVYRLGSSYSSRVSGMADLSDTTISRLSSKITILRDLKVGNLGVWAGRGWGASPSQLCVSACAWGFVIEAVSLSNNSSKPAPCTGTAPALVAKVDGRCTLDVRCPPVLLLALWNRSARVLVAVCMSLKLNDGHANCHKHTMWSMCAHLLLPTALPMLLTSGWPLTALHSGRMVLRRLFATCAPPLPRPGWTLSGLPWCPCW
jgi:hypothetical protein